ncbi:MAG: ester cyclase [Solirubrobacteraceae bacterium]
MTTITAMSNNDLCVRTQLELFGAGRLELADELIAAACIDHGGETGPDRDGSDPSTPTGPEAIRVVAPWLRGVFPDLAYEIHDAFGSGERVAMRCTMHGTHTGEFPHQAPTGHSFAVQQIHLDRIQDGRIAEHWAGRDDAAMMRQLGLV